MIIVCVISSLILLYVLSLILVRQITINKYRKVLEDIDLIFILVPCLNTFIWILWCSGISYRFVKRRLIIFYHWFINDRTFDRSKIK